MLFLVRRYFYTVARKARKNKVFAFSMVGLLVALSTVGNAWTFYYFDGAQNPNLSVWDSVWMSIISITTIGYGDYSPRTPGARIGTMIFTVIIGLTAFTTFLGMVVDWIIELNHKELRGMLPVYSKKHVLIVNFPSGSRVRSIIEELQSDEHHKHKDIILVADNIDAPPFDYKNFSFVKGSPLEADTFERANVHEAETAIVLGTDYNDPNSDSMTTSVVALLEHMHPGLRTIAECIDVKHEMLFSTVKCDAIVFPLRLANNLLVQETQDTGVAQFVDVMTSNLRGETIYATEVPAGQAGDAPYHGLAVKMLERDMNLVCVIRDRQYKTRFREMSLREGDSLVYICSERKDWSFFKALI